MDFLARISLKNRAFVALVTVVAAILGAIAITGMRQELIPPVELPTVSVSAVSNGATSEQMNDRIAIPIERQIATIPEVSDTTTNSSSSFAQITVDLEYGTDLARAVSKVEQAVSRAKDAFPDGTTTDVRSGSAADIPLLMVGVTTDQDALGTAQVVRSSVIPQLEKIPGVASAVLIGAPDQQVTIALDQAKAAQAGVTADNIKTALDSNGLSVPVGTVVGDGKTLDVTVGKKLVSLDDIKAIPIVPEGKPSVTLSQIASVRLDPKDTSLAARVNGKSAVALIVTPTSASNIVQTSKDVKNKLEDLKPLVGNGTEFTTIFDQQPFISESITSLAQEGGLGLLMAVVVILLFLVSIRSTVVTAISIPLSLLLAFIAMNGMGYSLNMITLSALTVTVGRVVDDSIVVIENIKRHLGYGEEKLPAILTAVREVASAVTASTLVTVLVFLPIGMVTGMVGELFKPFAFTVVVAMIASLFVALTIVPVLAYWFMKVDKTKGDNTSARRDQEYGEKTVTADQPGVENQRHHEFDVPENPHVPEHKAPQHTQSSSLVIDPDVEERESRYWLARAYMPALRISLKHPALVLASAVVVLAGTVALYPLLSVNLLGNSGQNMVSLTQQATPGTDMPTLTAHAQDAEKALGKVQGVQSVATTIGNAGFGTSSSASISYTVTTEPGRDMDAIGEQLERVLAKNSHGDTTQLVQSASPLTSSSVDVNVVAANDDDLQTATNALMGALKGARGAKSVTSNLQEDQPAIQVTVNRAAAARMGLNENDIVGLISAQIVSPQVGQITLNNIDTNIYIKLADPVTTKDQLTSMTIMGVPMSGIAKVEEVNVPPEIVTINGQRTATISVLPTDPNNLGALKTEVRNLVDSTKLPSGAMTTEAGAAQQLNTVFHDLGLAVLAAIMLIYVVLVWIFKSLGQPLMLLVSIPFAATGAIAALLLTKTPLGISSLIGVLMLTGIVVTNAIVLIDLINQYRRAGVSVDEAISVGARHRLRPIVMTAVATIAALIPMALGVTGSHGFISQPLAVTVIGGLLTSTLMTLVVLPALYSVTVGRKERRGKRADHVAGADLAASAAGAGRAHGADRARRKHSARA
ncbi:MAG: efflux RND transporter permease subunit [Actinomycetaceae bacterium]|nr:efflux RND transporter permease subunit [Actinomycetaceae bacterium]MDY6082471.1 efflux RND transporter permease subunit [Actinomycetaceae bacterium]